MKIILAIISSLRVDHVSVYGNRWLKMENVENLGKTGRVFTGARGRGIDPIGVRTELLTGLDARRWKSVGEVLANSRPEWCLPGRLEADGCSTALFYDNFSHSSLYENLSGFGTVHFVPGQGADPHVPAIFPTVSVDLEASGFNEIVSGTSRLPNDQALASYARNRALYSHVGHPASRLFDAVREYTRSLDQRDWFILVDSYGLGPPWDAPGEFSRYRSVEDLKTLAWPVAGPIDTRDSDIQKKLNFLRRSYADSCLFMDHLIGRLRQEGITLIVMSDHGVLIGDDDYIIGERGDKSDILRRQVLIATGAGIQKGSRSEEEIRPTDIFATISGKLAPGNVRGTDGRIIDGLIG